MQFVKFFLNDAPILSVPMEGGQVGVLVLFLFIFLSCLVTCFEQQLMDLQISSSFKRQRLGVYFIFCTASYLGVSVCNSASTSEILYLSIFFSD